MYCLSKSITVSGATNTIKISKDTDVWLCRHKQHERNNAWGLSYAIFPFVKLGRGQRMETFQHTEAPDVFEGIVHPQMKFKSFYNVSTVYGDQRSLLNLHTIFNSLV